ncbi:Ff.00g101660.m01.CDS01 [Fusarium sp. VM40]|nr:Ff.00g101660.m01.CDS01 [Fusarium sp. VM40]
MAVTPPAYSHDAEKDSKTTPASLTNEDHLGQQNVFGDETHRRLKSRHIQLIGIGGTIGTVLFVQIGKGLMQGGPGSLFIAFSFWCLIVLTITMCIAEMVSYTPISSPFVRFAGTYVDEALGFAAGWNFFIFEAALVPFEVTACHFILQFWTDAIPVGATIAVIIVLYALINFMAIQYFGETEFWAAIGKVILIVGLIIFTFIVMVGGNPQRDAFGFTYWKSPGAFAELYYEGALGKFVGFMGCLIQAAFSIAGPDYVAMAAGEAENPRKTLPRAFKTVFYRLTFFFVLGSLCVGILVPYDDPNMIAAFRDGKAGAAASPYVIAMDRLGIRVLPHIVNAMILVSAFSAGNSYVFCATRSLYGLALEGKAPRFLRTCTKTGVPIYCVVVVLAIALLSFLQLSNSSAVVLSWFVSLVTASQLINFSVICYTYIRFHRAMKAQGFDRSVLPYRAWFMPHAAYIGMVATFIMVFVGGYTVFLPGHWDVPSFLFSYTSVALFPILYAGWKIVHKTKIVKPTEIDLRHNLAPIEEYERNYVPQPPANWFEKILHFLFG